MIASRMITLIFGTVLLVPFAWVFTIMVLRSDKASSHSQTRIESGETDFQELEVRSIGIATRVEVRQFLSIHPALAKVWLWSPRRWIGFIGIAGCLVILFCLVISVCFPRRTSDEWRPHPSQPTSRSVGGFVIDGIEIPPPETKKQSS